MPKSLVGTSSFLTALTVRHPSTTISTDRKLLCPHSSLLPLADAAALCGNTLQNGLTWPQEPQVVPRNGDKLQLIIIIAWQLIHLAAVKRALAIAKQEEMNRHHASCANCNKTNRTRLYISWFLSTRVTYERAHVVQSLPPGKAISKRI
jgi:hypothetical protein